MKLSLKIMSALFIFAVIGITSCNKNEFGLNNEEAQFMESIEIQDITTEMIITSLKNKKDVKITENYYVEEFEVTGTLYEYINSKGITKQIIKGSKKPENIEEKGWMPWFHSVVHYVWVDVNGEIMDEEFVCEGASGGCFGSMNRFYSW